MSKLTTQMKKQKLIGSRPKKRTQREALICQDCAMMIANGEVSPETSIEQEAVIAEATAGWSLAESEPTEDHSTRPCGTCGDRLHGERYSAVKF